MAWMMPAAMVGSTVVGGLMGGGQEHIGPGDSIPDWMKQQRRDLAMNVYDLQQPEYYGGQLVADRTQGFENALQRAYNGGFGRNMQNTMAGAGRTALGGIQQGMDYMNQLQGQGPNQFNYDQGTFDQVYGNLQPGIAGAQDAATRDIYRQLGEQQIPGINAGAAGSGGGYGTKAFNTGAIAARGTMDRAADINAQFQMNALNQANQGGMRGGELNLGSANGLQNALIQGYGNFGQMGANMLNSAYNMNQGNINQALKAGMMDLGYDQSKIDAEKAKWDFGQNAPWLAQAERQRLLPNYGGAQSGGGESAFAGAYNGLQTGLGLYGMMNDAGIFGNGGQGYTGPGSYAQTPINAPQSLDWSNWG